VVVVLNAGTTSATAPEIAIADVGFVPYLNNLIQINRNILSGNGGVVGIPNQVTSYDMVIEAGNSTIAPGGVEVYTVTESYIYEENTKMKFMTKLLVIFVIGFLLAIYCYYQN
jgi:hypothetical protein